MHKKKLFIIFLILIFPAIIFAQEMVEGEEAELIETTEEVKDEKLSYYIELENVTEVEVQNGGYKGLENEIIASIGVDYQILDKLSIGGSITNYADILDENPTSEDFKFSTYLTEDRLAGYFNLKFAPADFFALYSSIGLEGNFRPDDEDSPYRVGFGFLVGMEFDFSEYFLTFKIENLMTPTFGIGNKNVLLLNDFLFDLRFDAFNFIRDDINLGFFVLSELAAENYFSENNSMSGETIFIDHEFFTGLIYSYDFLECSAAVALFNLLEEEKTFDVGIRLGLDFTFNNFSLGFGYKPHLYSKNISEGTEDKIPVHVVEFGAKFSL